VPLGSKLAASLMSHHGPITAIALTPDGKGVVTGTKTGVVEFWDVATGARTPCLRPHDCEVSRVALTPDGRGAFSGPWGNHPKCFIPDLDWETERKWLGDLAIRTWDVGSGEQTSRLDGHDNGIVALKAASGGRMLVSASRDQTVRVWDVAGGKEVDLLTGVLAGDLDVSSTGPLRIAIATEEGGVRLWDVGSREQVLADGGILKFKSVGISPDGRLVAAGAADGSVHLWDADTDDERGSISGLDSPVTMVRFSLDGRLLASATADGSVILRGTADLSGPRLLSGHEGRVHCMAFLGEHVRVVTASPEGSAKVWDLGGYGQDAAIRNPQDVITAVAWSPGGTLLATATDSGVVQVRNGENGLPIACLRGHGASVTSLSWSPTGDDLVSGSKDGTVRVWNTSTMTERACLEPTEGWVTSVTHSPDGRKVFCGVLRGQIYVFNLESGAGPTRHKTEGGGWGVFALCLSPDAERVAYSDWGGIVHELELHSGKVRMVMVSNPFHGSHVNSLGYCADGRHVVASFPNDELGVIDIKARSMTDRIRGAGDAVAVAAGPERFPWRLVVHGQETVIESSSAGGAVAWYATPLRNVTTHPLGHIWAGSAGSHLHLFQLRGAPTTTHRLSTPSPGSAG
jgi:WD40 repeat protein